MCAVVLADNTLQEEAGGELHAPFKLSSSSDVMMLFNDADVAVDYGVSALYTEDELH